MEQQLIIPGSREAVKEISLKLLPDLAKRQVEIRVSSAFIDPVLDTLAAGEIPVVTTGSDKGGDFGETSLIALILVPAVTSAVAAILTHIGMTTAVNYWQQRTRDMKTIFHAEVKGMIKKVHPDLKEQEVNRLAEKVVGVVWDYLSLREDLVNKLLREMGEGLTRTELAELRQKVSQYFNESELKGLCFDIGIDYEQFSAETKQDKVRDILTYCLRHKRIADLRAACRRARPNVSW